MAGLSGMKDICKHVNRSEATVLQWVREMSFPAKKIGGIWESDTDLITDWRKQVLNGEKSEGKQGETDTKEPEKEPSKAKPETKTPLKEKILNNSIRKIAKKNGKKRR